MNYRSQLPAIGLFVLAFLIIVQNEGLSQQNVPMSTPWDINDDGVVNILDLVSVAGEFGQSGQNLDADVNGDESVNIFDLVLVAAHFGETISLPNLLQADVTAVTTSGNSDAYTFTVTVESPDTGCDQYADWWEVLSEDGELLHRRTLLHSHVEGQPFTRAGGPVPLESDVVVIVRAHMNTTGYGEAAFRGTVKTGFVQIQLPNDFALDVEHQAPQPPPCAF